jgi:hypothetical protein
VGIGVRKPGKALHWTVGCLVRTSKAGGGLRSTSSG